MSADSFDPNAASFDPFDFNDVDPDKPGSGGGGQLPVGGYRVMITQVIVRNERGSAEVKCEVMAAKDESLVGRQHTEYLKWPKSEYTETGNRIAKEQLLAWCYAAKTTSAEEIRARQKARQGFDAGWLVAMVGHEVLIVIKEDSYTDAAGNAKTSAKAEGRVWSVDNPKGKGIPGWESAPGTTSPGGDVGAAAAAPQQTAAPATPAADPFAGLV